MDLAALKTELTTDPAATGWYATLVAQNDSAAWVELAGILNNGDGSHPRTLNVDTVDTGLVRGSVTFAAFDGLSVAEQSWFEWLTANGVIPVNAETLQQLAGIPTANDSIWAVADRDVSNAAMAALMQYAGTRAEELGLGSVSPANVRDALAL